MKIESRQHAVRSWQFGLVITCGLLSAVFCSAQQYKIDSLLSCLKHGGEDTVKVDLFGKLALEYKSMGTYDTALYYNNAALRLSQKIEYRKGIANAFGGMGNVYDLLGDYPVALDCYSKALMIDEELNDKSGKAKRLSNIGIVYDNQGNYPKALDFYLQALRIDEELKSKVEIAKVLGNIGAVYYAQADYPKALDYYFMALKINVELGRKKGIATTLGNIGIVYADEGEYDLALDYYFKALKMQEELGYKQLQANTLGNIGELYYKQGKDLKMDPAEQDRLFRHAFETYFKALKISEELGSKDGIGVILGSIGTLYTVQGRYKEAEKYLLDALKVDREIGALYYERTVEEALSELYIKIDRYESALQHFKRSVILKDSLFNREKNKEITRKEMTYEFDKKEAATKAENEKLVAVAEAEKQRQRIVLILVSCILLLMIVFAGFIFKVLRTTRRQKQLIEQQKHLVEEKQKEILDSIRYARRIQTALLPTEIYIERSLNRLMKSSYF